MPDVSVLWENNEMILQAAYDPAIPRTEGFHIILFPKEKTEAPWSDSELFGRMSEKAAKTCGLMIEHQIADWFNIQYNGNQGVAERKPVLHIHIFGRYEDSESWGGPLQLPKGKGPYENELLKQSEIDVIRAALEIFLD